MISKGSFFSTFGGKGVIENEGQVVSYTSQVEKAISSYLRVILRVVFIFGS